MPQNFYNFWKRERSGQRYGMFLHHCKILTTHAPPFGNVSLVGLQVHRPDTNALCVLRLKEQIPGARLSRCVMIPGRPRRAMHETRMETGNKDSILVGKPNGKRPLEMPWRWKKTLRRTLLILVVRNGPCPRPV